MQGCCWKKKQQVEELSPCRAPLAPEGNLGHVVVKARELIDVGGRVGCQQVEAQPPLCGGVGDLARGNEVQGRRYLGAVRCLVIISDGHLNTSIALKLVNGAEATLPWYIYT